VKLFVTGVGGFLGRGLALHLSTSGNAVRGSSRTPRPPDVVRHSFGAPVPDAFFAGVEALAHCAHDFAAGSGELTRRGTLELMHAAARQGVRRQVFVSSLAARADARTEYGRTKFALEQDFLAQGHAVVRPGTILGPGGLFGRMAQSVLERPLTPLVDGGRGRMFVIGVPDLCAALEVLLRGEQSGVYNLYLPEDQSMRQVLTLLAEVNGRRARFVSVPSSLLLLVLGVTERLGLKLAVDSDNLRGYRLSQSGIGPSRLGELVPNPQTLRDALAAAFSRGGM